MPFQRCIKRPSALGGFRIRAILSRNKIISITRPPKAATDMGVSSSESHDLTAFYEMLTASFGVLSQNTGFYPSLDRIVETTLRPLNLGPGGRSYNEPISCLQCPGTPASDEDEELVVTAVGPKVAIPCKSIKVAHKANKLWKADLKLR